MQSESVRSKMEELRLICDREVPIQQHRIDTATLTFGKSLDLTKLHAQQTLQFQVTLQKLKIELREMEDNLVKALAVKTRKEAKMIATADSMSAMKARVEELRGAVEDQRAKKDEYADIISQQAEALKAFEEKCNQNNEHREEIEEAIVWYNKVLGLRIECGQGVKFIFTNIDANNPDDEYFFTVRHENDVYTLIDCNPQLNDAKELLSELNKTNGLFKFVRTMREKFLEALARGNLLTSHDQDISTISMSAPNSSISSDSRYESPSQQEDTQRDEHNRNSRKLTRGKGGRAAILSPGSAASLRRSPRFKVKK